MIHTSAIFMSAIQIFLKGGGDASPLGTCNASKAASAQSVILLPGMIDV